MDSFVDLILLQFCSCEQLIAAKQSLSRQIVPHLIKEISLLFCLAAQISFADKMDSVLGDTKVGAFIEFKEIRHQGNLLVVLSRFPYFGAKIRRLGRHYVIDINGSFPFGSVIASSATSASTACIKTSHALSDAFDRRTTAISIGSADGSTSAPSLPSISASHL